MPVRDRRPEDEQPLFRAVGGHRLMGPVGGGQDGSPQAGAEAGTEGAASQSSGEGQESKGPIAKALDKAQENNWVYGSMADKARQGGLVDKADGLLSRLTGK